MIKKTILILIYLLCSFTANAQEKPNIEFFLEGAIISEIVGNPDEIWVATYGRGIYHYSVQDGKWENYSTSKGNLQQDFFYCVTFNDDFVWAGSSDGLFTLDRKRSTWRKRKFGMGGELGNWIRAIEYDEHFQSVWIGRFKYLTRFDINKQRFFDYDLTVGGNVKTNNIKYIKLDGDSLIWFASEVGIHKYDKSKDIEDKSSLTYFDNKQNRFNEEGDAITISDMICEPETIWFGLEEFVTVQRPEFNIGGLYEYDRNVYWERLDTQTGLPGNGIFCLEKTGNILWASTYEFNRKNKEQDGKGIALINRVTKEVSVITKDELNLRSNKILSMYFDGVNMWLGTDAGLIRIKLLNELASWKAEKTTTKNTKRNNND